ncbi:MAG: NAD+ synthase [Nitrospirae bacterium]|nr:NAD+ synthase [Nitrospirota bacterium]
MRIFRIAMVQMNPIVGDLAGNVGRISRWIQEARHVKPDLVVFPELAITGYPPEDLLLKPRFVEDTRHALEEVIRQSKGVATVVGYVAEGGVSDSTRDRPMVVPAGRHELYNAAAVIAERKLVTTYCKSYLPNYGVFDESRYFHQGRRIPVVVLNGTVLGVNICEDIWFPEGPTRAQAAAGAEVIVNINASPFHVGKSRFREQMLATRARDNGVIVTYTNMVGGQDELVFDGNSLVLDQTGEVILRGKAFEEDLLVVDLNVAAVARNRIAHGRKKWFAGRTAAAMERVVISADYLPKRRARIVPAGAAPLDPLHEVYRALVLGVRDYVRKNRFKRVLIGLSGGIDSALTAVIAADALGPANVLGVFMPSPYTSRESREDVAELARRVGIPLRTIPITNTFKTYLKSLAASFEGRPSDTTEENLQARIRGNILMGLSNKFGHLVLTTGNKSEMSVGYATLYGDMAGGFAVIKDVPKTMVYDLARLRNRMDQAAVIPKRVFERPPSAELKPHQKDEDSLPPYPILDPILKAYVEEDRSPEEIVDMGFERETVERVIAMVDRSEYKRRQSPIGIKITHRAFGKDRRMPITNGYRNS